jgi:diguanylate cyclase (GGDEF)-like protein
VDRDALTGLRTGRPLTRIRGPAAAIWIDVDRVKELADREGHHAGDDAIRGVAHAIRQVAGDGATHRTAGDEFLVVLPGGAIEDAAELAERIRAAVEATARHNTVAVAL